MENFDLTIVTTESEPLEIKRSVELANWQWDVILQSLEQFSSTYRKDQSQIVTTYVTRNQLPEAVLTAQQMNKLLEEIDKIQASIA
jgi:hypothetical protein